LFYWIFKWSLFVPVVRLVWRPKVTGRENVPGSGPAILVANHTSAVETFIVPAMIERRLTFPAKAELFAPGGGPGKRLVAWFLAAVGQLPMDRSGGRASAGSMDGVLQVLRNGELLGIFPEGTRSPDGRLHKGKTGVARLVLQAQVPVVPIGIRDSLPRRTRRLRIPYQPRTRISIGKPLDFDAYAPAATDRDVLRYVTDEIMAAVQELSGQEYVDAYASSVKAAKADGRELASAVVVARPGLGRRVPPVPTPAAEPAGKESPTPVTEAPAQTAQDVTT
jgi:1-acyl-sn-glycerol-3-phosphate acyltransferase